VGHRAGPAAVRGDLRWVEEYLEAAERLNSLNAAAGLAFSAR
jgi:hypothetical protein